MDSTKRFVWVDLIRVSAIYLVVVIHTAGVIIGKNMSLYAPIGWWPANLWNSFARASVPLFFMVSGTLLLGQKTEESIFDFFKKRLSRIGIPFLFWSLFFTFYKSARHPDQLKLQNFLSILVDPAYYHLWFLYSILGLYLAVPFLRAWAVRASKKEILTVIGVWFVLFSMTMAATHEFGFRINANFTVFLPIYFGYFFLGYLLKDYLPPRRVILISAFIVLLGSIYVAFSSYYMALNNQGVYSNYPGDYLHPVVVAASIALFIILRSIGEIDFWQRSERFCNNLKIIGDASFGIYLIHVCLLELLRIPIWGAGGSITDFFFIFTPAGIPLLAFVACGLSFVIVIGLRRIPFIRRCV